MFYKVVMYECYDGKVRLGYNAEAPEKPRKDKIKEGKAHDGK